MDLWKLTQRERTGYDTYCGLVVCAPDRETAAAIHPSDDWEADTWASSPEKVTVQYLGKAAKGIPQGVVLADFQAG